MKHRKTGVSKRERDIYAWVLDFEKKKGYSPSFREIGTHFKIGLSSVQHALSELARFQYVSLPPKGVARGIVPRRHG